MTDKIDIDTINTIIADLEKYDAMLRKHYTKLPKEERAKYEEGLDEEYAETMKIIEGLKLLKLRTV